MAKKKTVNYFGVNEEEAVVRFLNATTQRERDAIFSEHLYKPILKMVESIIKRYKLIKPDMTLDEQITETTAFLIEKFYKFKPEKNKKAYSYYGTVVVNHLKGQLLKFSKTLGRDLSYEDISTTLEEEGLIETYEMDTDYVEKIEIYDFIKILSLKIQNEIKTNKKLKENDIKVALSVVELLDNWEDIIDSDDKSNILNRNKVLYIIRETTHLSAKDIRNSMKKLKIFYFDTKKEVIGD